MLHEVLFTLWNCPGEILRTSETEWLENVELNEFLHPGERKLMQKIVQVAIYYHEIEEFRKLAAGEYNTQDESHGNNEADNNITPGLYVKAFGNGLNDVLDAYRNEIINLEGKLLHHPHLTLTYVLGSIEQYGALFEVLRRMINMIKTERIHGCLLIGRLHQFINSGIPSIVQATKKIIKCINTVFYRHLCDWIIYGNIVDVYNEFFIGDANCLDKNFMHNEYVSNSAENRKKRIMCQYQVRKFYIKQELLPSMISLETAETILFMGRVVWIVCNDPRKTLVDDCRPKFKKDVWDGEAMEYYQKIQRLENYPFSWVKFTKTIEECLLKLTKSLWSIMVEEAKLLEHLQLIRDYYALGRGEIFRTFIAAAEGHLSKDLPKDCALKNLNFILAECARKIYGENDLSHQKFELALARNDESEDFLNPWSRLEMNFDVLWPLHIVFHSRIIRLYNKLFCFLLRITKTQIGLHKLWQMQMSGKQKIDKGVWTLRHNLMFLVNNLQYYLQVEVIEAEFSILKSAVDSASEFEDIIRQHSKFLSNVLSKTFVMTLDERAYDSRAHHSLYQLPTLNFESKDTIYSIIMLLLRVCDEFCVIAGLWGSELTSVQQAELNELKKRSDAHADMLLRVLYTTYNKVSGTHVLQLLSRLDYNRWYSKSKPDFNLSFE